MSVILISPEDLAALVETSVRKVLSETKQPKQENEDCFLSEKEAAAFVKLSRQSLKALRDSDEVPFKRFGATVRYLKSDLLALNKKKKK